MSNETDTVETVAVGMSVMDEICRCKADAISRFSGNYEPMGPFRLPHLKIGNQSFPLHYKEDDPRHDDERREWLGIMLCAALKTLVDAAVKEAVERATGRISNLVADGCACRSCGAVFDGLNHPHTDEDCPKDHANWDRATPEQIAAVIRMGDQ